MPSTPTEHMHFAAFLEIIKCMAATGTEER
jgi:hypothetical protein